jgi:protein-arginine kinase activator protein McsA
MIRMKRTKRTRAMQPIMRCYYCNATPIAIERDDRDLCAECARQPICSTCGAPATETISISPAPSPINRVEIAMCNSCARERSRPSTKEEWEEAFNWPF